MNILHHPLRLVIVLVLLSCADVYAGSTTDTKTLTIKDHVYIFIGVALLIVSWVCMMKTKDGKEALLVGCIAPIIGLALAIWLFTL